VTHTTIMDLTPCMSTGKKTPATVFQPRTWAGRRRWGTSKMTGVAHTRQGHAGRLSKIKHSRHTGVRRRRPVRRYDGAACTQATSGGHQGQQGSAPFTPTQGKPTGRIPHLTPLVLVRIQVPQPRILPMSPHIFGFGNRLAALALDGAGDDTRLPRIVYSARSFVWWNIGSLLPLRLSK
jgi:hypothetical protein